MSAAHTASLVSIGQSKLVIDHRHLGSNPKLPLDVSCPYSKFGVNRPKQTKVIEWKPKVDNHPSRLQHYNKPVFVENLVNKSSQVIFSFMFRYS